MTNSSIAAHSGETCTSMVREAALPLFNGYRKGLQLFVLYTRDKHAKGLLWAGSPEAARGRADRIVGSDSFVLRANGGAA